VVQAPEETRVDRWLWAVRIFKTRSDATAACKRGHVKVNGRPAKPATLVKAGDQVEARAHQRPRILEVVQPIEKRVGAAIAATCLIDTSPPPPPREEGPLDLGREQGAGRPTKRERRALDRFRGRS
jgi:ribosome-associated heat shock protein Hsp15